MKKKRAMVIGIAVLVAAGGAAATGFYQYSQKDSEPQIPLPPQGMSLSESVVTATGLTSVGMAEETWELGFLEDGLYVEETYLNIGEEVDAHTPVFKVTEESLKTARRELEKKVQETALNRRQGEIIYQTGLVDAKKELDLAAVEADYAQSVYDSAIQSAQKELEELQKEAEEAQEKVEEYTASIEEDYYYTYYKVGELEATWKDNAAFLAKLYETWDVDSLESVFGGSGGKNGIGYVTNQVTKNAVGSSDTAGTASPSKGDSTSQNAGSQNTGKGQIPAGVSFSLETVVKPEEAALEATGERTEEEGSSEESAEESTEQESTEQESTEQESTEQESTEQESTTEEETTEEATGEEPESGQNEDRPDGPSGGSPFDEFLKGGGTISGNDAGKKMSVNVGDDEIKYNIYLAMKEEADESKEAYEAALEAYEEAKAKAQAGIEEAKSELAVRTAKLSEQEISFEKDRIEAQKEYDLALSNQQNAQMVYDTAVKQLEEDYETLKEAEETAAENLALFEETIGDGTFYTGARGTVVMNAVRANTRMTEDTLVLAYSNPDMVSVAASVDQGDIASISVGEEAYVVISGYGSFEGKVTSFNPVSSSGGSSKVTYTVNVQLEGEISGLESNLTAYLYFGLTEEEKEMLNRSAVSMGQKEGTPDRGEEGMPAGEMPEGMPGGEMPDLEQMPSGFSGGNLPKGMENPGNDTKGGGR